MSFIENMCFVNWRFRSFVQYRYEFYITTVKSGYIDTPDFRSRDLLWVLMTAVLLTLWYSDGLSHTDKCDKDGIVHYIFKRPQVEISNNYMLQSLRVVFMLANTADLDEMPHIAAFNIGLYCLSKYSFRGFQ